MATEFDKLRRRMINKRNTELGSGQFAFAPPTSPPASVNEALPGFLNDTTVRSRLAIARETGRARGIASALGAGAGSPVYTGSNPLPEPDVATPLEGGRATAVFPDGRTVRSGMAASGTGIDAPLVRGGGGGRIELETGEVLRREPVPVGLPGYEGVTVQRELSRDPSGDVTRTFRSPRRPELPVVVSKDLTKVPNAKEANVLRIKADADMKVPGMTVDEKQSRQRQLRAELAGTTTPFMDRTKEARTFAADPFTPGGVTHPEDIAAIKKAIPDLLSDLRRSTTSFTGATEPDSILHQRELNRDRTAVEQAIKVQGESLSAARARIVAAQKQRQKIGEEQIASSRFRRGIAARDEIKRDADRLESARRFDETMSERKNLRVSSENRHQDALVLAGRKDATEAQIARAAGSAESLKVLYKVQSEDVDRRIKRVEDRKIKVESELRNMQSIIVRNEGRRDRDTFDKTSTVGQANATANHFIPLLQKDLRVINAELDGTSDIDGNKRQGLLSEKRELTQNLAAASGVAKDATATALSLSALNNISRRINVKRGGADSPAEKATPADKSAWTTAWADAHRGKTKKDFIAAFRAFFGENPE